MDLITGIMYLISEESGHSGT